LSLHYRHTYKYWYNGTTGIVKLVKETLRCVDRVLLEDC